MGRKLIALNIALAFVLFGMDAARGQNPHGSIGARGKMMEQRPDRLQSPASQPPQLSPEDRQRFNRNAERWMQMNAQERNIMRDREKLRRDRIKQEAETALGESGLQLDPQKRAQFESRYVEERTKIEHAMREELETKRRQEVPALIERLKKEFQPQQANPTPKPSASAKSGG